MNKRSLAYVLPVLAVICGTGPAAAQSGPPPQAPAAPTKTIGKASHPQQQTVPSLIVMNAKGASLAGNTLVLSGISPNSIIFADRPVRSAGHALTTHLIDTWNEGKDSFAKDPPNATVSVFDKDGGAVKDAVVVLKNPKLDGDKLTFAVDVLEGDITGGTGAASVFIDLIGLPASPMSFAGVARRAAFRGAFYAGAVGAAAAAADYGYPPPPPPYYAPYAPAYAPYYRPYY